MDVCALNIECLEGWGELKNLQGGGSQAEKRMMWGGGGRDVPLPLPVS